MASSLIKMIYLAINFFLSLIELLIRKYTFYHHFFNSVVKGIKNMCLLIRLLAVD